MSFELSIKPSRMLRLCLVFLSLCFHPTVNEILESYTNAFRTNVLDGKVIEVVKGHNKFSCAMVCLRKPLCKMAIIDEKNDTCMISKTIYGNQEFSRIAPAANGRYLYIQMVRRRDDFSLTIIY